MDSTNLNAQPRTRQQKQNIFPENLPSEVEEIGTISTDPQPRKRQPRDDRVSAQIDVDFGEPPINSTSLQHSIHHIQHELQQPSNETPIISTYSQTDRLPDQNDSNFGEPSANSSKNHVRHTKKKVEQPHSDLNEIPPNKSLFDQIDSNFGEPSANSSKNHVRHIKQKLNQLPSEENESSSQPMYKKAYHSRNYKSKAVQRNLHKVNHLTNLPDTDPSSIENMNYDHTNSNVGELQSEDKIEEIIIKCDTTSMAKKFVQQSQLVWLHPTEIKQSSLQHIIYLNAFEQIMETTTTLTSWDKTFDHINKARSFCFVVISTPDWQKHVQEIEKLPMVAHVIVDLTLSPQEIPQEAQSGTKKKAINKIDYVIENGIKGLTTTIEDVYEGWKVSGASKKLDLPAFIPISGDSHSSDIYYNHWALQVLPKFTNRDQAKQDFIELARAITKDSSIEEFEQNYNQYNRNDIFHWYTKESFLYKLTNNCLRLSTPDSIQYCRLILNDLQEAIEDQFATKSKDFSGLLYRGAYISDTEWDVLENNIGGDLEMHGFLSTSKHRSVAEEFALSDPDRKALITIVVPSMLNQEYVSGFAEVKEFSEFGAEEEVLFNIMSKFTIESVTFEELNNKKFRHLVLVYGAHSLRRNMRELSPELDIQIENKSAMCFSCNRDTSLIQDYNAKSKMAIDLINQDRYFCMSCVEKLPPEDKSPLAIIDVSQYHKAKASMKSKITIAAAQVIQYKEPLNIKFYGQRHTCAVCQQQPEDVSYIEIVGGKLGRRSCKKCFTSEDPTIQKMSQAIVEKAPFTIHGDVMEDQEFHNENYQKSQLLKMVKSRFSQAEMFAGTQWYEQGYERAIRYYERWIDRDYRKDLEATALAYSNLASAYKNVGRYNDAIEFNARALEIRIAKFGEESDPVAESYNNLGLLYCSTCNYNKAMKYCAIALKIKLKSGTSTEIAESYNNVGNCYFSLGKYTDAAKYYEEALKLTRLSNNHAGTATSLSTLGNCYKKLGDFKKSFEFCKDARKLRKQLFGREHPETATAIEDVGLIFAETGEYNEAFIRLKKSAFLRLAIFGDTTQAILKEASSVGKSGEVITPAVKKIILKSKCEDASIAQSMHNIGVVYEKQNNNQEAVEWLEKALEKRRTQLGDKHLDTGMTYDKLSCVYERMGKIGSIETALKYAKNALEIKVASLGDKHPETATTYTTLGSVYKAMGDYKSTVHYLLKALDVKQATLGDNHSETANAHRDIGSALLKIEEYEQATSHLSAAYEIKKSIFSESHPDFVQICDGVGYCLLWKSEYQKALKNFLEAEENRKLFPEMKDDGSVQRYKMISECYGSLGMSQIAWITFAEPLNLPTEMMKQSLHWEKRSVAMRTKISKLLLKWTPISK